MSSLVFVYGSLRKGKHNHFYLEKAEFVKEVRLEGYRLCDSYPTAIQSDQKIVEAYRIDD